MALIDLVQICREMAPRDRNKAAILLTPDFQEQNVYAKRLAQATGTTHFDVLDTFRADPSLSAALPGFQPDEFFRLLAAQKAPFLIVSGIEVLLAPWICQGNSPKEVKRNFCYSIEMWDGREKPGFLLVTQQDPVMAQFTPLRYPGSRVVIPLSQTIALP